MPLLCYDTAPAVEILKRGGIVAIPTESSYGLAVDARNEMALQRLYQLKHRPQNKPLLVLVSSPAQILVERLATAIPSQYEGLISQFWPGPLTLVFKADNSVNDIITGGTKTIGVRMSPHRSASALVEAFGTAVTATSANISGLAPCVSAEAVVEMFGEGVNCVLDGGRADGLPSTLVILDEGRVKILREGQISREMLSQSLSQTAFPPDLRLQP
ncbi:MAG: L-threonylcarbamoyladenylate synthase [Desulforhopalus sp.]|nr:L-threonylcarbamoyladenylate synthase [Desulforhopalus sp.]